VAVQPGALCAGSDADAVPAEPIEILFDGARLPGYFVRAGHDRAPTLIAMSGFDGSADEVYYWIGPAAAERGWNCLIFEGPGQRGALHLNPGLVLRPDYEAPVGAVVDYAVGRPEVDPARLALIGYCLGGFLATRAAAFEPRIRAVIADSLIVDVGAAFAAMWPKVLQTSFPRVVDGAFTVLSRLRLDTRWGRAPQNLPTSRKTPAPPATVRWVAWPTHTPPSSRGCSAP
jgi:predicted alpha/beta-fold hydrolase